ncbi:MAG: hypothetical protein KC657_05885 [Myxococcales bacterium]|nr:hypothetical protein [Myxococcales bacterium]
MTSLRVTLVLSLGTVLASLACGGAATQDVLGGESSSGASSSASSSSSGGTSGGTSSGAASSTSGAPVDAGTTSSSSGAVDAGACTPEEERNDNKGSANELVTSRCGTVRETDGDDSDFLTFTLKPTTTSMFITFDGNVTLKVDVDGRQSVTMTPTSKPPLPFVKGRPYVIQIQSANGAKQIWRVNLNEK